MKRFKKILKRLLIVVVLLIVVLLALPFVFEDQIVQAVKDAANDNLNAQVDFGGHDITIFDDFPNLTLDLAEIKVDGVDRFADITLAEVAHTSITINLGSLFGDSYKISKVGLEEPRIHVVVFEDGTANYDIAKVDTTAVESPAEEEEVEEDGSFSFGLEEYYVHGGEVIYDDASLDTYLEISNLNHEGSGDFTLTEFLLETQTTADAATLDYEGIRYVNHAALEVDADLDILLTDDEMKLTFKENIAKVNELALHADGWVSLLAEDINMDLTYAAPGSNFKELLSLVPMVYMTEFASVQTKGEFSFDGFVKGTYNETIMPGFGFNLRVDNGYLKYPDLPESVDNIQVGASIIREDGPDLDNLKIDVPRFNLSMAGAPVAATLKLRSPLSDPDLACTVKSQLDLTKLARTIPMEEGEEYSGMITADLELAGRLSALEEERYEEFKALGQLIILDMSVKNPLVTYETGIKSMYLNFSPQFVELSNFDANAGNSDFHANGRMDNMLAWYLKDEVLKGNFTLTSQNIDLRELMAEDTPAAEDAEPVSTSSIAPAAAVEDEPLRILILT